MTPRNNALGALFTVLAALCYAGMDAISKFLVADYAVGQIMWMRISSERNMPTNTAVSARK